MRTSYGSNLWYGLNAIQKLIIGYLAILFVGFSFLHFPFFQLAETSSVDHLLMATSALSTTGLSSVNLTEHYNFGGQLILLLLIQIGGVGYMSIASFVMLIRKHKISPDGTEMVRKEFGLPLGFKVRHFIKSLVFFTLLIEFLGALVLSIIFWQNGESSYIWKGIFHSISAFCTAGFSLFPNSLVDFSGHFKLNLTIFILSIIGALGFIVFVDFYDRFMSIKSKVTLTSKIIIRFTFLGIFLGGSLIAISQSTAIWNSNEEGFIIVFFQAMSAVTTVGFSTVNLSDFSSSPLFLILILMFIGASPAGTGGGVKSTTITALYAQLKSTLREDRKVIFLGCEIPEHRLKTASANFLFYILLALVGIFLLMSVQPQEKFVIIFEAISALGTVGLSLGLTAELSSLGKVIISIMMFLGRIGALSFGIALFKTSAKQQIAKKEDIVI